VLVIDLKYKAADTKTKWCSAIAEKGVVFASTRHYDNELPGVVEGFVKALKYHINPQASNMMAEYLGNDLEKIEKEIEKLTITIPLSKEISTDDVHRLIGVSKEYNIFEYANALGARDALKSYKIAQFLGRNEKNNPMVLIIGTLYSQFSKVMMLHSLKSKDTASISRELGLRGDYFARQYIEIARKFDQRKAAEIISILREFDARSKGVESVSESSEDMLKELTFRILK
jgi:DNA polymerase III subunit delta